MTTYLPTQPLPVDAYRNKILPLRAQAEVRNRWLKERLETMIPELMQREGFDLWLIIAREYNEDPVIMTLLPEPAMAARRRTILVFARQVDGAVERLTLDRYGHGDYYARGWEPEKEDQFACLRRTVSERDPQVIGLNFADDFAFGDGLTMAEMQVGRTGNDVIPAALARANAAGITPSIYSHPLGYHGHAAGPVIGLWDQQDGVPGKGDYPLFDDTCYSIDLARCKGQGAG